jgi:DNA-binding response OmpR family regulator
MSKKILIIEDEKNLVELLKINFESESFEVIIANDGADGLLKTQTEKPDVVVLDIRLPILNGWEVCKAIKSGQETKNIPVIILTAATQKSDYIESQKAGCDMYITKPFDPIELVNIVSNLLNKN